MRKLPTLTFLLVSAAAVAQNNGLSACLPGGAGPVTVGGDSITGPYPLGITFSFFGVNYDHCFLSDHGLIYLTDAAGLPAPPCNGGCAHTYTIDPISLTMTTPVIAPFWTDSNQYGTSTIAIDPNVPATGMTTITWFELNSYQLQATQTPFTFQCILDGTTGHLQFVYGPNCTNDSLFTLPTSQDGIVGVSPGNGIALPPSADFSMSPVVLTEMAFEHVVGANNLDLANDSILMIPTMPGWIVLHTPNGAECAVTKSYGNGCDSLELDSASPPIGGQSWDLTTTGFNAISQLGFTYFSLGQQLPPIPLSALGFNAPGCDVNIELSLVLFPLTGVATSGSMTVSLTVPVAATGLTIRAQTIGLTTANAAGFSTSNGETGTFGN